MYIAIIFPHIHRHTIKSIIFPIFINIEKNAVNPNVFCNIFNGVEKNISAIFPGVTLLNFGSLKNISPSL